jgi:RNA polymerase sigma-70 factor (ECF subfamily)
MNIRNIDDLAEDIIIIKKILNGNDVNLFKKLIEKYKGLIFSLALKMTGNYSEAEDLTQEIFVKAYSKLSDFKVKYQFKDWLYKIAYNNITDKLRKRKFSFFSIDRHIQTEENEFLIEILDTKEIDPEQKMLKKEREKQLYKTILALPIKHKTLLILRYLENLTYEEISKITGLTLNTIKIRIHRAQKKLYLKFQK